MKKHVNDNKIFDAQVDVLNLHNVGADSAIKK